MIEEIVEISFDYNKIITKIKVNIEGSISDAVNKFIEKEKLSKEFLEFIFNDKKLNLNEKIEDLLKVLDKDNEDIIIQVKIKNKEKEAIKNADSMVKCPICLDQCSIKIENYLIKLYNCKNGHKIENIELDEFKKIQNKILSMKKCTKCNKNKKSKDFQRCINCKIDLCTDCIVNHEQNHDIIDSNLKYYRCELHNISYSKYCTNCKLNICSTCLVNHQNHDIITFEEIKPNIDNIKNKMKELRISINLLEEHIKELINNLHIVKDNMEIYYQLYNDIINNYDEDNTNMEFLQNLNDINNDNIVEEINHIINYETKRKGYNILNIFNKMKEYNKEITINYKINTKKNQKSFFGKKIIDEEDKEFNIFGPEFVESNKNICKIIFEEQLFDLTQKFKINNNVKQYEFITIKLKGIQNIKKIEQMFKECSTLLSVPDIDKWDISCFTDLHGLFFNCSSLISLPDISIWNTENVKDFSHLFSGCSSLISLPDISKWNLKNAVNIYGLFNKCSSLRILPDISIWDTKNINNFYGIFLECKSLISLPDISKWNTEKVTNISGLFTDCNALISLPDLSKWNIKRVTNLSGIFAGCKSLTSLPDISLWNIDNVNNLSGMFANCSSLTSLPDISVWNTNNVTTLKFMFYNCSSLSSLPDISQWNIENVNNLTEMFSGCKWFLNIPQKFKNKNVNQN